MDYINTETGEDDLSEAQVRAAFPNISFGAADFPPAPFAQRSRTAQPTYDSITQEVLRAPSAFSAGEWRQVWTVVELAPEVAAARRADAITQATANIKAERDRRQSDGGVQVGGKWFLSSDREAGRYNSLLNVAASLGAPGTYVLRAGWRTMQDGVTQDMTPNLARQILAAGMAQFAAIDDAAQTHIAAMAQAADPLAYDFSGSWPATFGDLA